MQRTSDPLVRAVLLVSLLAAGLSGCGREAPVGTLAVTSDPSGAAIVLDGTDTGRTTPAELVLPAAPYTVTVTLPDHLSTPARRRVTVAPAQRVGASFVLTGIGRLAVLSDPPGAAIVLDGEPTGTVTPDTLETAAGEHEVAATAAGRVAREGTRVVTVATGGLATVSFTMVPAGTLRVVSTPVSATVLLDGVDTGHSTPASFLLPAGDHVVAVRREGWTVSPESLLVALAADADTTVAFTLQESGQSGVLAVTSAPPGAAVLVDGAETGSTTPASLTLPAGDHVVELRHPLFRPDTPATVTVPAGDTVPHHVVLSARRVALVENMSSVNCVGCPEMNALLDSVVTVDDYGPDRLVAIKFSQGWLGPDPHYTANPDDNDARTMFYYDNTTWDGSLPTLFLDGRLAVAPDQTNGYPPHADLLAMIDQENAADPGFALAVAVDDPTAPVIQATVTLLTAVSPDGNGDWELDVALVESPIHYDEPPGNQGETEFHWIMRDFQRLTGETLTFDPAAPDPHAIQFVNDAAWVPDNLWVIALVQDRTTLRVIQAGSSRSAAPAGRSAVPAMHSTTR